jgi:mono/diheme cytochrome c family protein
MTFRLLAAVALAVWTAGLVHRVSAEQGTSTWSGVYTEAQAKSGAQAYMKNCSECHLEDMAGDGFAPPLKGPEFMNNWNALTVGDLFERIRVSMPQDNPGSLSRQQYADIVAFIFSKGEFPAGKTELSTKTEELKLIAFEATKP